jgi:hypothetical protein
MVTIAVGALLGWAFSGALIGWGIVTTAFGAIMLGASLGSLFMPRDMGDFSSSPTYGFGPISNTMSQLVPIPVIYGKCRVAGNIIYQAFADDKKELQDLYILVGEGPVTAINSVLCNDQNPAALEDCSLTTYLNTAAATHDSRDPSGARPYPDDVALICLTLKAQEKLNGTPTVTSIIDGVKVWTPAGFAWSRNPVWIILDILCHPRYGLGYGAIANGVYQHPDWDKIDYACAVAAATYCDGTVSYGTRFQLDFALDTQRPIRDVLADFLASCRGYMIETDKLQICIDAPASIYSREITPDNIVEGSFTFWQAADEDVCNRITIDWIDPGNSYERVTDVFQDSADIADRGVVEKSISLLPVTRSGQVGHMGYYLLKTSLLVRNFCSFGVGIKDCDIVPGEVLLITFVNFTGWNQKPFRVVSVKDSGQDVMTVTCSEYIADVYDDSVLDITHHIDTSLTTNYKPDDVTEMAITEQLETLQDGSYNLIAKISWTPPASYSSLELWYRYSSEVSWKPAGTLPRGSEEYYLPCTGKIGDTLYVKIYVISRLGVRSDGQTTTKTLRGDTTAPEPPTNLQGIGGFKCALLTWHDPADGDLDHIDIYRSFGNDEYAKIGAVPRFAEEYIDNNLGVLQTAWYKLRAVDVAKNESVFGDVISITGEALRGKDIPEQSITPSKLSPKLERLTEEIKQLANAGIISGINADEDRTTAAVATRELDTKVTEGLAAEASERLTLAARVNDNTAAIQAESVARANADSAEASAREMLAVKVGENTAGIQTTANAIATVDGKVGALYTLRVDANGNVAGFAIGSDGVVSEFAVVADKFKIAKADGSTTQIFTIDTDSGLVQIVGDLIASGSITGDKINAAAKIQLGAGGQFITGENTIVQMASGVFALDSSTGIMTIRDPNDLSTGDYIKIDVGDITSYKYLNGAYRSMKSLRKMEVGSGVNGVEITLPGYWPSQPKIQVSPNSLQSYNKNYPSQNQELIMYADSIEYDDYTGEVTFIPRAYLQIAAGGVSVNLPVAVKDVGFSYKHHPKQAIPGTFITDTYSTIPSGATNIIVKAKLYAQAALSEGDETITLRTVKITVTAYIGGVPYTVGAVTFAPKNYDISSEPTSYYVEITVTIPSGSGNVYLSAYIEYPSGYVDKSFSSGNFLNCSKGWLRFDSLQYSLSGSTQLAEGTLNYMAIAE